MCLRSLSTFYLDVANKKYIYGLFFNMDDDVGKLQFVNGQQNNLHNIFGINRYTNNI